VRRLLDIDLSRRRTQRRSVILRAWPEIWPMLSGLSNRLAMNPFFVMAGLVPAIHVFLPRLERKRGCPAQGRA
jgi:hypothetical protein